MVFGRCVMLAAGQQLCDQHQFRTKKKKKKKNGQVRASGVLGTIAKSDAEFEEIAVNLAYNTTHREELRDALLANRHSSVLFDTGD